MHEEKESKQASTSAIEVSPDSPASAWPLKPVPLVPDKKASMMATLFDTALFVITLLLMVKIGLVIAAWCIDRGNHGATIDSVSYLSLGLIEANSQMTTAFTIIFVTIMSTLVRRYALYKAQNGAYVSELEQLQGSISLPSTIKLIWSLRAFTTTSLALVGIWSFYYLGSQASQREYQLVKSGRFKKMDGVFPNLNYLSGFHPDAAVYSERFDLNNLNDDLLMNERFFSYYMSSTEMPTRVPGTDIEGRAIVPHLKSLLNVGIRTPGAQGADGNQIWDVSLPWKPQRHGWVDVSKQSQLNSVQAYTSFLGRSVEFLEPKGLDPHGRIFPKSTTALLGDYKASTGYFDVGCAPPQLLPFSSFPSGTRFNQSVSFNMTEPRVDAPKDTKGNSLREFDLWVRWPSVVSEYENITEGSSSVTCNITYINVDMKIHCQDIGCFPHKLRYANRTSEAEATSFSTPFDNAIFASNFFDNLLASKGNQTDMAEPTAMAATLASNLAYTMSTLNGFPIESYFSYDDMIVFNRNLLQYINSYYMLSQDNTLALGLLYDENDPILTHIKVKGAFSDPRYAISWPWIAVDIVSTLILLVAAFIAHILRKKTLAPDIFGYVSSLTRDNPYLNLPDNGSALGGIERARLLRGVKVKIGDVSKPEEPTGRVGLAQVSGREGLVENLKPTTTYV